MGKKSKTKSCREASRVVQIGVWIALSFFTLFILCSPLIFTQPYLFDWDFFDFSRTGDIGDTIGGITAPFIGLLSVFLLALTLLEQVRINREQKRFNDTSRVMAILSHIQQMDSQIEFLYSTPNTLCKGKGLASLDVFSADKRSGVIFAFEEVVMVESRVSILVASVFSMLSVIQESSMESKDKMSYMNIVTFYMKTVKPFYEALANKTIQYLLPRGDDSKWQIEEANLIKRSNSVLAGINTSLNQKITTEW